MSLLDRRVLVVSGKGGVGRTTVAAAIGLAAARSGRHAVLVEVASQHRLPRLFTGEEPADPYEETPLFPGLVGLSIDPQRALEEYLGLALRVRALARALAESRAFSYLAAAAPGLKEIVTLGKVWHLAGERTRSGEPRHDLVVLDAPATGHGVGMLATPRTFLELARVGRVHAEARAIADLVHDRTRTGIVLVTLPEEMPVEETIDATGQLRELGLEPDCVVVNALYPELLEDADAVALEGLEVGGETGRAAVEAARSHAARRREHAEQVARLEAALDLPRLDLPFLFRPEIDVEAVGELADALGPALEAIR